VAFGNAVALPERDQTQIRGVRQRLLLIDAPRRLLEVSGLELLTTP
jgi:hypothetical protein